MYNLKIVFLLTLFVFAGLFGGAAPACALEIIGIRMGQHGASIRTVMDLDAEVAFSATIQGAPPRIIIDLPGISGKPTVKRSQMPPLIRDIKLEPLPNAYSRLSLILEDNATIRSAFMMPATGEQPVRLVIDAAPASDATFNKAIGKRYGTLDTYTPQKSTDLPFAGAGGTRLDLISKPKAPTAPAVNAPETLPLIVIDAGHGGFDPGATAGTTLEKNITLAVSRAVRTALEATGRYRVKLTRETDTFIRLPERVQIARRAGADLFVSIHADSVATGGEGAHGASIYTLSDKASDAQTARLAARENEVDLLAGSDVPIQDKDTATILVDLAMRETMTQSKRFAGDLVKAFKNNQVPMLRGPHRYAGFVVLKAPDVPSVLIELGFVSNPAEAKKLNSTDYRNTLSTAIAHGIDAWFKAKVQNE